MADKKLIPLAYGFTYGSRKEDDDPCWNTDSISITGKAYLDWAGEFAEYPNGKDGVVCPVDEDDEEDWDEEEHEGEPYAYVSEITEIMEELGYMEVSEVTWSPTDSMVLNLETLKAQFAERGYELIEDSVDDSMLNDEEDEDE